MTDTSPLPIEPLAQDVIDWNQIMPRGEASPKTALLLSIAISLKRIADQGDRVEISEERASSAIIVQLSEEESTDYAALAELKKRHPDWMFQSAGTGGHDYHVTIRGPRDETITKSALTQVKATIRAYEAIPP